jgi:hypothetical protein
MHLIPMQIACARSLILYQKVPVRHGNNACKLKTEIQFSAAPL